MAPTIFLDKSGHTIASVFIPSCLVQRCLGSYLPLSSSQHNLSFVLRALDHWRCKSLKSRCRQPSQVLQSTNALDMDQHGLDCAHSSMLPICLSAHFCVFPLSVSLLSLSRPYDTTNQDSQRSRMDEQKVGF